MDRTFGNNNDISTCTNSPQTPTPTSPHKGPTTPTLTPQAFDNSHFSLKRGIMRHDSISSTISDELTSSNFDGIDKGISLSVPSFDLQTSSELSPPSLLVATSPFYAKPSVYQHKSALTLNIRRLDPPLPANSAEFYNDLDLTNGSAVNNVGFTGPMDFPTESTNAYSYAHLLPNSLALRLNVLKRSLEILIERPELIHLFNNVSQDALNSSSVSPPPTPINDTSSLFYALRTPELLKCKSPERNYSSDEIFTGETNKNVKKQYKLFPSNQNGFSLSATSAYQNPAINNSTNSLLSKENQRIKIETNASSAALAAFFRSKNGSGSLLNSDGEQYNKDTESHASRSITSLVLLSSILNEGKKEELNDQSIYENIRTRLKSIISLLSESNDVSNLSSSNDHLTGNRKKLLSSSGEIAFDFHNLLLSNVNDQSKERFLQRKLLYALATPFYESISTNNMGTINKNISSAAIYQHRNFSSRNLDLLLIPVLLRRITSTGGTISTSESERMSFSKDLSFDNNNYIGNNLNDETTSFGEPLPKRLKPKLNVDVKTNNRLPLIRYTLFDTAIKSNASSNININRTTSRPFHSLSTSKNMTPQAIITCETENPWRLRAVNDLLTLVFGLGQSNIKETKLMDLIADNSKVFVLQKLTRRLSGSKTDGRSGHYNKDIIFAGEIVAVKGGEAELQWCSLWAKRKGEIIILMFDKISCAAIDIAVTNRFQGKILPNWEITSIKEVTDLLLARTGYNKEALLSDVSSSLNKALNLLPSNERIQQINDTRYFTLDIKGRSLPCAVYAKDNNPSLPSSHDLTLKIHTLPYIAGIFVISAANYSILSYNRSILKNLFGYGDLIGQSIDKIIPNFTKLIEYSSSTKKMVHFLDDLITKSTPERFQENPKYLLPGLVLPEHFFRKIQSKFEAHKIFNNIKRQAAASNIHETPIKAKIDIPENFLVQENFHGKTEAQIEDMIFLNSKGIYGKHANGSRLVIDVQLRVSSIDTLVLWITYSSDVYGVLHEQSEDNALKFYNNSEKSFMFDDPDLLSGLSNIHSKSGFTDLSNVSENPKTTKPSNNEATTTPVFEEFEIKSKVDTSSFDGSDSMATVDNLDSSEESGSTLVIKLEEQLRIEETKAFEQWKATCKHFPKEIGAVSRIKKITDFIEIKKMGEGAYGLVSVMRRKDDPNYEVAVKSIYKHKILIDLWVRDSKLGSVTAEIQTMTVLAKTCHPNILRILDFFEDDDCFYVELPIHGNPPAIDLFDYIEIKKSISEIEIKYIFRQICQAVLTLHSQGLVHRDIKDENVIIDSKSVVKLIDFGLTAYIENGPFDVFVGTMEYAPPEVLKASIYDGKPQDVWSLGVLLYTMVYKENPFYNVDEIMEGELSVPYVLSDDCYDLITKILTRNITERPTVEEILASSWLKDA